MNFNIESKIYLTNIFLIDWDDTLFPSTWINKNKINLQDNNSITEYKLYFLDLDKAISNFLQIFSNVGDIYIVTNASLNWIRTCLNVLQLTSKSIILNKIRIISARDLYSNITNSIIEWKIRTFKNIIIENLNKINKIRQNTYLNIFSLGDAKYEYIALLNLNNFLQENEKINENIKNKNFNFLLKSIKFVEDPTFEYIIDELKVIEQNKDSIINSLEYIDLKFT
jgi:hypothetical protein